ncbi:hypothetical protein [Methylobacterium radiotolerans]
MKTMFCAALASLVPLTVYSITSASAFELTAGRMIKITNVVESSSQRWISGPLAPSSSQSGPSNGTVFLSAYQGGSVISWQPVLTPSCTSADGYTTVAVLYDTKKARSGKINCLPSEYGSASDQSRRLTSGTYSSNLRTSGDTIELRGQMTYTEKLSRQGGVFGGTHESTTTTKIQQSARIRVVGDKCEVISLSEVATQSSNSRGNPSSGNNWTGRDEFTKQNDMTSSTQCEIL